MKYRKKPSHLVEPIIEAVKLPLREYADNPYLFDCPPTPWLSDAIRDKIVYAEFRSEDYWYYCVKTLEGVMRAGPGDYIIRGVEGELYPCKGSIFNATYEQVD